MMPEERLVAQIREFVRQETPEPTPEVEDLAEQYAELCEAVNERLLKCQDFLEQGMRSEAVHEMQVPPPLLEQVNVLNFREVTKWRNLCDDLGLRVFTPLRVDIMERLREESTKEEALAPLLNEYRRAVHNGSRDERIHLLRRIREHDPENPVWAENLRPLEEAQLETILPEVQQALENENLPKLEELREDLEHPTRVCPPPEPLLRQVKNVLRSAELSQARVRVDKLTEKLDQAFENRDEEALDSLLAEWDAVTADEEVSVDDTRRARVENIRSWLDEERRKRQADKHYRETLADLEAEIAGHVPDRAAVRRLWQALLNTGRDVPAETREGVMRAIARADQIEHNRNRRRVLLIAAAAALFAVVVVGIVYVVNKVQTRNTAKRELAALVDAERYPEAVDYLDRLKKNRPPLYLLPEMQRLRTQAENALSEQQHQKTAFESAMTDLRAIRQAGFGADEARVKRLLDKARRFAAHDEERAARIDAWVNARKLAQSQERERELVRFRQGVKGFSSRVKRQRAAGAVSDEGELEAIAELETRLAALREGATSVPGADASRLAPIAEMLSTWRQQVEARIEQRQKASEKKQKMLRAIRQAPPDIDLYTMLIRGFVEDYSEAPHVADMRRVLNDEVLFRDAQALANFTVPGLPMPNPVATKANARLGNLPGAARSVWHDDLTACFELGKRFQSAQKRLADLKKLPGLTLKRFKVRPVDGGQWRTVYYPESIRSREETGPDGGDRTLYWGQVYETSPNDPAPFLEHRKFSTAEYEVRIFRREENNLVPHARFVREFQARLREREKPIDIFVVESLRDLLADDSIPAMPRAWAANVFVDALGECALRPNQTVKRARELLEDTPRQKNWFHTDNPDIASVSDRLEQALQQLPDLAEAQRDMQQNRNLLQAALSRKVNYVGVVRQPERGAKLTIDATRPAPEFWILYRNPQNGERRFRIVAKTGRDGNPAIQQEKQSLLYPGQLVFAPKDNRTTDDLRREIGATDDQVATLSSWPR